MNSAGTLFYHIIILALFQINYSGAIKCSYYGEPGPGPTRERMADEQFLNPNGLTCSTLPHLPLGTHLKVTNQRNGKSIVVKVTDRIGGKTLEDTIDLTYGAFGLIANHADGTIPCTYEIQ